MDDDGVAVVLPRTSFRQKLKHLCFASCLRRPGRSPSQCSLLQSPRLPSDANPAVIWIKARGQHRNHSLSKIREKCRAILGIPGARLKKFPSSAEFRYDPLSYAQNFEDAFHNYDDAPARRFSGNSCRRRP